jgi:branched-subunit amino acid aminotransferase/4-amino-4-deoxychorismate lyase
MNKSPPSLVGSRAATTTDPAATMESVLAGYEAREAERRTGGKPNAEGLAWISGEFVPLAEARIPLLDQGFLRSDLTYDVPAVWDGRFFRLDDHLDRLQESCDKLRMRIPMDRSVLRATLVELVALSGIRDAYVELIVTRGLKFVREYESYNNHLYLMVMPYVWTMPIAAQMRGGRAIVTRTVRRTPPGAMDPTVKNLQWGDFVRGWLEAMDRGSVYALLPDGDGNITEGAATTYSRSRMGSSRPPHAAYWKA